MLGDKILYGYPSKTYFELYDGRGYSDKIYSVQTRDFPKELPAVIYVPEENSSQFKDDKAHQKHVFVIPTPELEEFLGKRGVVCYTKKDLAYGGVREVENSAWVNRYAFDWVEPQDTPEIPEQKQSTTDYKKRSLLAFAVAIVSLLN